MQQLDKDVIKALALVIDGNPTSRSVMIQHLREFGFGIVKSAARVTDAREILEARRFDVVLCDNHFENSDESGQELLEELRREQMLPHSTVFIMVTGDATYQKVAEAAEAALDSYLIKPFSANTLFERLKEARQRKRVLKDIFDAMEAKNNERAADLCIARFEKRELYWLYAARIGAELLFSLKRTDEAKKLFDAVVEAKAVPWARLGVARVQLADGDVGQARRTLESLMGDCPQYADSYDVMGKVQMEQGQIMEALAT
jgi:CheY-like chemotaxis protein